MFRKGKIFKQIMTSKITSFDYSILKNNTLPSLYLFVPPPSHICGIFCNLSNFLFLLLCLSDYLFPSLTLSLYLSVSISFPLSHAFLSGLVCLEVSDVWSHVRLCVEGKRRWRLQTTEITSCIVSILI